MKNSLLVHASLVAALILVGGSAAIARADPILPTDEATYLTDVRGGRTDSSPQESWDYTSLPTPHPSKNPAHRLNEIAFGDNSTALDREGIAICRQTATEIQSMKGVRFLIVGFSHKLELDPTLGQRRADAVRNSLARDGLLASRIETASFGSQFSRISDSPHPYMFTAAQGVEIWTLEQ